jgi:sec-independent protein translocase protein TatC
MVTDSEDKKMPLTDHLEELRKRLIRILIVIGLGFGVCYAFKETLFAVLTKPVADVLPKGSYMIYTNMTEAFFIYMEIAFFASVVLTAPFTLYQVWKFLSPGLFPRERRYVLPFMITSTVLFSGGVLFGYFVVLPPAFSFFVTFTSDFLKPMLSLKEYLSLSLKFLLAFGLSFELPVFIFFLTKIGLVNAAMLSKQRRYAILVIFIAAAVLTPSPDALSQVLMAIPLMILYELSIYVAKFAQKKRPVEREGVGREDSDS